MTLLQFLNEQNKYFRVGGNNTSLFQLMGTNEIFHENNIDFVIKYIKESTLEDALLIINPEGTRPKEVLRIVSSAWLTLHLEIFMQGLTTENYQNEEFARLLFGSFDEQKVEIKSAANDEDDEEVNEDEDEDDDEDEEFEDEDNEEDTGEEDGE